jgi:hypothetical protein
VVRHSQTDNRVTLRSDYSRLDAQSDRPERSISDAVGACDTLPSPGSKECDMPPKQTYNYNGQQVTGEPVTAETSNEPWAQYTLSDGTTVKVKIVLLDAARLDAYNDQTNDPIYQLQFQQIIGIVAPEKLKRKAN